MPVGAGSIKRAAKTAAEKTTEGKEKTVEAAAEPQKKPASAKKTAAPKKASAKSAPVKPDADKLTKQKTYGITEELPFYLL